MPIISLDCDASAIPKVDLIARTYGSYEVEDSSLVRIDDAEKLSAGCEVLASIG